MHRRQTRRVRKCRVLLPPHVWKRRPWMLSSPLKMMNPMPAAHAPTTSCTEYLRSAGSCFSRTVKQSLTGGKQSGEDGSR